MAALLTNKMIVLDLLAFDAELQGHKRAPLGLTGCYRVRFFGSSVKGK